MSKKSIRSRRRKAEKRADALHRVEARLGSKIPSREMGRRIEGMMHLVEAGAMTEQEVQSRIGIYWSRLDAHRVSLAKKLGVA